MAINYYNNKDMKLTDYVILAFFGTVNSLPKPSIQLQDNLDEAKNLGFCIDFKGFGDKVKLDLIQMHSCKEDGKRSDDMLFQPVKNSVVAYGDGAGRCLKPVSPIEGSLFTTSECDLDDFQQSICWMADGTLRLQSDEFKCLVSDDQEN